MNEVRLNSLFAFAALAGVLVWTPVHATESAGAASGTAASTASQPAADAKKDDKKGDAKKAEKGAAAGGGGGGDAASSATVQCTSPTQAEFANVTVEGARNRKAQATPEKPAAQEKSE